MAYDIVASLGTSLLTEWYDLCSPYKPIPGIFSAGEVTATSKYRTTWYNYIDGLETSGGLESISITSSSNTIELFFDMNPTTLLSYKKADLLLIDSHRVYRKDGSGSYLLQGTYPVYFTLAGSLEDATGSQAIQIDDAKGMTYSGNFYVIFDDTGEIATVTNISGTTFTITRGTNHTVHPDATIIYMYAILDGTPTGSLGTRACPVTNDYVEAAKYVDHSQERLLIANSTIHPSRMWYTSYNPDTLQGDEDIILAATVEGFGPNWKDVGRNDGPDIKGMLAYINNNIYFWKDRALWYITGDLDTGALLSLDGTTGGISNKTVVEIPGGILFLSKDGIMFFNGQKLLNISKFKINTTILSINWNYAYLANAVYYPKYSEYHLFVPTGTNTTCDTDIVLNLLLSDLGHEEGTKCYSIFTFSVSGATIASSQKTTDSYGNTVIWMADNSGNLLLMDDTDADSTAAINAYIVLKNNGMVVRFNRRWISIIENHKGFRRIITDFLRTGNWYITAQYSTDGSTYSSGHSISCDTSVKGAIRDTDKWNFDGKGKYLTIKYSNVQSSQPVRIFNYIMHFKEHKVRS